MNRDASGGVFQPAKLEVDGGILDRSLQILPSPSGIDAEAERLFATPITAPTLSLATDAALLPAFDVTPEPGMCVKTRNLAGGKIFVNFCKINEIPPARPVTEDQLQKIIAEEDYATDFKIPMSLGEPRDEKDKAGAPCHCADVAVNAAWYEDTMQGNLTFTTFLVHVAMEGLCEKYGDVVNLDRQNWAILKNKKYMGAVQRHRIQQRASGRKIKEMPSRDEKAPLIREVDPEAVTRSATSEFASSAAVVRPLAPQAPPATTLRKPEQTPKFKMTKEPKESDNPDFLVAEVEVPGVRSAREMLVEVGEDRIIVEARKCGHLLDVFVPFNIDQDVVGAEFHRDKQVLTLTMPLLKLIK